MTSGDGKLVWLIVGASGGFGRAAAELAAGNGDIVAATVRREDDAAILRSLTPGVADCRLADVTRPDQISSAVDAVERKFGGIDVLLITAGYGLLGAVEEVNPEEAREQFETNFFGTLNVIKAVLPGMRARKGGHIFVLSAAGGFVSTPGFSVYDASKAAVESLCEGLAQEVTPFGVRVTIIQPGPFRTAFARKSLRRSALVLPEYAATTGGRIRYIQRLDGRQEGDPRKAAAVIMTALQSATPPLRLPLGRYAVEAIRRKLSSASAELDAWEQAALSTALEP